MKIRPSSAFLAAAAALAAAAPLAAQPQGQPSGMDALVAPIALYPDPLVGLILPASTSPNDLEAAASGNDQSVAPAVADLEHYPDVVQWMAQNQQWSGQLGAAFAGSPSDVMNAIQDVRQQALADGALQSTPQQVVVQSGGVIQILPANPSMVYVPSYDPDAIFMRTPGFALTFSAGYPIGDWLGFYPVWGSHAIFTGDWYSYSRSHGGWRGMASVRPGMFGRMTGVSGAHEWKVASNAQIRQGNFRSAALANGSYARPSRMGAAAANSNRVGYQQNNRSQAQEHRVNPPPASATFPGDEYGNRTSVGQQLMPSRDSSSDQRTLQQQNNRTDTSRSEENARPNSFSDRQSLDRQQTDRSQMSPRTTNSSQMRQAPKAQNERSRPAATHEQSNSSQPGH